MKKTFKTIFTFLFYKVKWEDNGFSDSGHFKYWDFYLKPRYLAITLGVIAIWWVIFFFAGTIGLVSIVPELYKPIRFFNSEVHILKTEKRPSIWAMYRKSFDLRPM